MPDLDVPHQRGDPVGAGGGVEPGREPRLLLGPLRQRVPPGDGGGMAALPLGEPLRLFQRRAHPAQRLADIRRQLLHDRADVLVPARQLGRPRGQHGHVAERLHDRLPAARRGDQ
ncbi:hypothetical protein LUX57_11250 [Actinomadura madurae]|uniref:hypothetical protein n=1 Tax=Actinomadura madurae TaxID=1993 RepID=UPI0020D260B1|nr:hypothetical protein [Actinomadura madurae]MCP9965631.1 hypothetical protein [Actinomadura madurae]